MTDTGTEPDSTATSGSDAIGSPTGQDLTTVSSSAAGAESTEQDPPAAAGVDAGAESTEQDLPASGDDGADFGAQFRRQRTALLVIGAIGILLIGFAVGVLARIPLDRNAEPDPSAVDTGFSQDMSAHHAQAVDMAGVALIGSTDNDVRRLAYDILTTQQAQLGRLQGWLQLWGKSMQDVDGYMGWMTEPAGGGHDHVGGPAGRPMSGPMPTMPGMATNAEMTALRQATGPALDTMFLQLMLRHHQGGMSMIRYAAEHAETTAVRSLASTMETTQRGEAQLMTTMLTSRGASPLPLT
ncbi:DUF305 domain-containing protein [Nocardia sp. NPDC051463]|uniref:DUF305 domain-containing protein n=1 Tax=Nocardia sp. NPDC051463 TaxID=3154845 RepID=UPI0034392891